MSPESVYQTPQAFRRALTERIKPLAETSPWTEQQLQRQFAYDRLLERLYLVDDGWVVKGAVALLARDIGVRSSLDVDIYREIATEIALSDLRRAAALDIDWVTFELGASEPLADGRHGVRVKIDARIGTTLWSQFSVDLVGVDMRMTGEPEEVPPLVRVLIPDVEQHGYRVYPIVDHVADKIAATFELYGPNRNPSTRYRDLVDLVAIVSVESIEAGAQLAALRSEFERRHLAWQDRFAVPDEDAWRIGYAKAVKDAALSIGLTLEDALEIVWPFADPLFAGTARGYWSSGSWSVEIQERS